MIFGLLYFCVVILCVNRSRSSFILYRIVKRHSRQSNVRRIWTCADNGYIAIAMVARQLKNTRWTQHYMRYPRNYEFFFKNFKLNIIITPCILVLRVVVNGSSLQLWCKVRPKCNFMLLPSNHACSGQLG